jgi:hypothetical protein
MSCLDAPRAVAKTPALGWLSSFPWGINVRAPGKLSLANSPAPHARRRGGSARRALRPVGWGGGFEGFGYQCPNPRQLLASRANRPTRPNQKNRPYCRVGVALRAGLFAALQAGGRRFDPGWLQCPPLYPAALAARSELASVWARASAGAAPSDSSAAVASSSSATASPARDWSISHAARSVWARASQ